MLGIQLMGHITDFVYYSTHLKNYIFLLGEFHNLISAMTPAVNQTRITEQLKSNGHLLDIS